MSEIAPKEAAGSILVVEDDEAARFGLANGLRARGLHVLEASSCAEALAAMRSRPDLVITDLRLPDGDAVELLPRLRTIDPLVPVYIITGFATVDVAVHAVKQGAEEFFTKPVDMAKIMRCVETALERRSRSRSGKQPRVLVDSDTRSEAMRQLEEQVMRLRQSDCTVLILGETGTGKSRLARRIHDLGARGNGPFVDINCAGLSRDFVESELFGHERGAFTGAHAPKQGLLEAARGGTVFLDEIGDIDLQVQPKILKVLEERRFRRMGGVREQNAEVRLIAATHLDLLDAVEKKAFRADLFYRISTMTLTMPALRERAADIVPLAREILARGGGAEVEVQPSAWDKLSVYTWPGNIRELKNVLERALLMRSGDILSPDDIRFDSGSRASGQMPVAVVPPSPPSTARGPSSTSTLEEMERTAIIQALTEENGRVKNAAVRLGIPRSTLYQKIKNYRITLTARTSQPDREDTED